MPGMLTDYKGWNLSNVRSTDSRVWTRSTSDVDFCRSMKGRIKAQMFSFDQMFNAYNKEQFALVRHTTYRNLFAGVHYLGDSKEKNKVLSLQNRFVKTNRYAVDDSSKRGSFLSVFHAR